MKNIQILLISVLFLACGNQEKKTEINKETPKTNNLISISKQQFESEKMQLGSLEKQTFNTSIKVNGIIDVPPENKASVSSFIGGYVTKIPLLVGDKVKKGQLVASIKNLEFVEIQQKYLEINAQLDFLKNEYLRQKMLFDEQITSQKNYLKAESLYKSSLATFNGLSQKLKMMNINLNKVRKGEITSTINLYAPISGYITKLNVNNGAYVSSTNELLEIVNTDHIHLELNVFEKDILTIKKDQKILFKVPESSNKTYTAEVHLVGTSINNDRTIKVHGHIIDEKNIQLISGMFVEANIIVTSKEEISLPKSAILKSEIDTFILTLIKEENGNLFLEKTAVTIGLENEKYVEVLNFKELENKKILTKGVFMLNNL